MGGAGARMKSTKLYVFGLLAAACCSAAVWLLLVSPPLFSREALFASGILAIFGGLARISRVRFARSASDFADAAVLPALVLFGPLWAVLVELPSTLHRDPLRTTFVISADVLKLIAAGAAFSWFSTPLLFGGSFGWSFLYGTLAASLVFYTLDALLNSTLVRIKYGTPLSEVLRESFLPLIPSDAAAIATALLAAYTIPAFGWTAAAIVPVGCVLSYSLLQDARELKAASDALRLENERLKKEARDANLSFACRLTENLGEKDGTTPRLAAATATYASDLAGEFGLSPERASKLGITALLMDAGLAGLPDEVLSTAPEKLNSVGKRLLEEHPVRSEKLLATAPGYEEAAKWARWHHERPDGTGYPDRMKEQWLPLEAKILGAASSWSSLILDWPYRPAFTTQEARERFIEELGRGVDQEVGRVLLRLLETEGETYARAADERFSLPTSAQDSAKKLEERWANANPRAV